MAKRKSIIEQVVKALRSRTKRGYTDAELAAKLNAPYETVSRRRRELVTAGYVSRSSQRRGGQTVWVWA